LVLLSVKSGRFCGMAATRNWIPLVSILSRMMNFPSVRVMHELAAFSLLKAA
jgi:hypothetical protein